MHTAGNIHGLDQLEAPILPGEPDHAADASGEATFPILTAVCSVLDRHPDPLFIVDRYRKLRFHNLTARRVLETHSGLSQHEGCLSVGSALDDKRLEGLLSGLRDGGVSPRPHARGLRLRRSGAGLGWCVIVHSLTPPAGGHRNSLFLLHTFSRMHARSALSLLLHDLFGFSRAETAAVLAVIKSGGVNSAARQLSLSRETVRTHLKAAFRKCDIHSTLELAALIRAMSLFGGPDRRQEPRS